MRGAWRLERSGRRHTPPRRIAPEWLDCWDGGLGVGGRAFVPALLQAIAVAVHLQDMNVVGEPVEQGSSEALGAEDLGPLLEGQVAGDQS